MLTFSYTAKDNKTGDKVSSIVQAESEKAAAKLIIEQGLSPMEITIKNTHEGVFAGHKNRVSTKDKVLFSRQLATMINAGLPLVQSLRSVQEQSNNKSLQVVIGKIISDVEGGNNFSDALSKHPRVFNPVFVSLVQAGESSGTLDKSLERIADQQEKDAEIVNKVRGALVYPVIVLAVISLVIVFMLTTVLPQVEQLYEDLNQSLPFLTAILLAISKFIINFWPFVLLGMGLTTYGLFRYFQSSAGGIVLDKVKMTMPLFGKLFMKMYMARFARTATTLTASGVPMLETLRITGDAVNNVHVKGAIMKAANKVKSGTSLAEALKGDENFLSLVPQMIRIGEQSGALDTMLDKTAEYYERELDNEIKAISSTIEPVLMIVLGLVAGVLVAAILLPVYGLVGQTIVT